MTTPLRSAADSVARTVALAHPDVPLHLVNDVVANAAAELAGVDLADFPRLLRRRCTARLAAMTGSPTPIAVVSPRWRPAW
jgi:hypothetical protein